MKVLAMIGLAGLMSACTIARPLELNDDAAANDRVYVAISDAVYLKNPASRFKFWRQTFAVVDTLKDQPGFLGFSARIELLGNRATTMTAWADQASMRQFAYGDGLHREIAANDTTLIDAMFYGREFDADGLPSWDEALALLSTHGRHHYE